MPEFKEFRYDSCTGSNSIYARMCVPDSAPKGIVQIAHGIADHICRYDDFALFLAGNGWLVVGEDHLGHGKTIASPEEKGFFAEEDGWSCVIRDILKLQEIVRADYPDLPYIMFGHSMGSFLMRTFAIMHPDKLDGLILCGTAHQVAPVVKAGKLMAELAVKKHGARSNGKTLNDIAFGAYNNGFEGRTGFDWVNSSYARVDEYIADPFCGFVAANGLFRDMMNGISFIIKQSNINRMNKDVPVLFIAGKDDPVGEKGKGVERAYNAFCKAGLRDIFMKIYPLMRHEILNEPYNRYPYNDVLDWLERRF